MYPTATSPRLGSFGVITCFEESLICAPATPTATARAPRRHRGSASPFRHSAAVISRLFSTGTSTDTEQNQSNGSRWRRRRLRGSVAPGDSARVCLRLNQIWLATLSCAPDSGELARARPTPSLSPVRFLIGRCIGRGFRGWSARRAPFKRALAALVATDRKLVINQL